MTDAESPGRIPHLLGFWATYYYRLGMEGGDRAQLSYAFRVFPLVFTSTFYILITGRFPEFAVKPMGFDEVFENVSW